VKISDLIYLLESIREEHGDLDLALRDADTDWSYLLKEKNFDVLSNPGYLEIGISYFDQKDERIEN